MTSILLYKSECLLEPIQMQISQNQKIFAKFFFTYPKFTQNLEYFETKD